MLRRPLTGGLALFCLFCGVARAQTDPIERVRQQEWLQRQAVLAWQRQANELRRIRPADGTTIEVVDVANGMPVYFTTQNYTAGRITGAAFLHAEPERSFGLTGIGLRMGIWDAGPVFIEHRELRHRVLQQDRGEASNHATHVAGTMIGAGIDPDALGMAPGAQLRSYNWNFHVSEMQVEARDGLLISNHSYGKISGWHYLPIYPDSSVWHWFGDPTISETEDYTFGYYDRNASLFDDATYRYPYYLPVIAAGNEADDRGPATGTYMALTREGRWQPYDFETRPIPPDGAAGGFDTITSFALAKNPITVGSIGLDENANPVISPFSSRGPADDGRIKPDLVGPGEGLYSSIATGEADYARYSGTSMATPAVAGSLLLLQQLARRQQQRPMRAATLKALALHTARDLGNPGPDYVYGWGLIDAHAAARLLEHSFSIPSLIQELELADGDTLELALVAREAGPVRITLSWTDPPGPVLDAGEDFVLNNPSPSLVNDLDLRLVDPLTGRAYPPYTLDVTNPADPAGTGDNRTDPVEQIYVASATPGLYTLRISHKGRLFEQRPQPFSLILSGFEEADAPLVADTLRAEADVGRVSLTWSTLFEAHRGEFQIERAALHGAAVSGALSLPYIALVTIPSQGISSDRQRYTFVDEVRLQGTYRYRVLFRDHETGDRILVAELDVNVPPPESLKIVSIYPNPMTDRSRLILDLPAPTDVRLTVHDVLGRTITEFTEPAVPAGRHTFWLDASDWAAGLYFARIRAGGRQITRRLIVVR